MKDMAIWDVAFHGGNGYKAIYPACDVHPAFLETVMGLSLPRPQDAISRHLSHFSDCLSRETASHIRECVIRQPASTAPNSNCRSDYCPELISTPSAPAELAIRALEIPFSQFVVLKNGAFAPLEPLLDQCPRLRDKDEIDFFIDRKIEWATDAMLLAGVCSVSTSLASRIAENRFHSAHYCGRALGASTAQSEKKTLGTISDIHNYCKMNISSVAGIAANFNSMIEAAVDTRQRILSISHLIGVGRADELVAFIDLMLDAKKMFCDDFSISQCIESVLAEAKADGEVEGETKAALFLDYLEEKGMLPRREGVDLWTRDGQIWLLNI